MEGRLSSKVWDSIMDEIITRYDGMVDMIEKELLASGNPPFTVRLTPREQYQKLLAMRQAGDPGFWTNPAAQAEINRLAQQFGPLPPMGGNV